MLDTILNNGTIQTIFLVVVCVNIGASAVGAILDTLAAKFTGLGGAAGAVKKVADGIKKVVDWVTANRAH